MAGWQDYPDAPAGASAQAPAAPGAVVPPTVAPNVAAANAPAWAAYANAPAQQGAPSTTPAPESDDERLHQQLAAQGYQPSPAVDWVEKNILGPFSGFSQQAQRAASLGLTDKISAGVPALNALVKQGWDAATGTPPTAGAPSPGDIYQSELAAARGEGQTYSQQHPVASPIATTLGTVFGTAAPAGAIDAAATNVAANKAALTAGAPAVPLAANPAAAAAPTLAGRVWQGAKAGATIGGLAGFGGSNDKSVGGDLLATAGGAGAGGAIGGAVPIVANKVVSPIWNWAARSFSPESAANNQALARVAQRISQDAEGNGPTAQDVLDMIAAAPASERNVIADFGGGNVLGEAGRVVRAPGPGRTVGLDLLTSRAKGEPETVANLVQSGISGGGPAFDASQALIDARAAAAAPKYEAAGIPSDPAQYASAPVVDNPAVTRLLQKSTAVKNAIGQAKGLPDYADLPDNSIVLLDKAYKTIGGNAAEAAQAGNGEAARDLNSLRMQLRNAITGGDPNHPYQQALDAYSGPSASLNAIDAGRKILTKSPSQIAAEVSKLAPGDAEFYKLGAADTLVNNAESTGRTGNPATRIAQSVRAQNQLKPLFGGDTAAFQNFITGIDRANTRMETKLATIGNSATAGRIAEDEAGGGSNPALAGAAEATAGALTGESIPVGTGLWNMVRGLSSNRPPQSPAVNAAIAKILYNPNPAENQAALARIMALQNMPSQAARAIVPLASLAGAHPATSLAIGAAPVSAVARRVLGENGE